MNRLDVINFCVEIFNYNFYLEIGCNDNQTFDNVKIKNKIGVDPLCGGTIRSTSDQFFANNNDKFDLIFIDGDHTCRQVFRDIKSSLDVLSPNGTIIVHDCNPPDKEWESADNYRCGDGWKTFCYFRQDENIDSIVCDFDYGVGIIKKRKNKNIILLPVSDYTALTFDSLVTNRANWLQLSNFEEAKNWLIYG